MHRGGLEIAYKALYSINEYSAFVVLPREQGYTLHPKRFGK